jgi:hypothetical protein
VLKKSDSIEESGIIVWQLLVALAAAWILVLAMVVKGIQVDA